MPPAPRSPLCPPLLCRLGIRVGRAVLAQNARADRPSIHNRVLTSQLPPQLRVSLAQLGYFTSEASLVARHRKGQRRTGSLAESHRRPPQLVALATSGSAESETPGLCRGHNLAVQAPTARQAPS